MFHPLRCVTDRRRRFVRVATSLFLAIAPLSATADPSVPARTASAIPAAEDPSIARAEMAIRLREPERAVSIWREAAARGLPEAAYRLGVAHRSGLGVAKDLRVAARWFGAAAEKGHHDAQFALGMLYQNGKGVVRDRDESIRLFTLAARGGHRKAREHLARLRNSRSRAYALADARIDANRANPRESLALAIHANDSGSAREALARGAPVDGVEGDLEHWKPLILAIDRRNPDMIRLLLEQRANPNLRSRSGEPALVLAIRTRQRDLVRLLLHAGAKVDSRSAGGTTPLMEAARVGQTGMVRDLLAAGADPSVVLDDGTSAAELARRFGHEPLSRELMRRGAPIRGAQNPAARLAVLEPRSTGSSDVGAALPPVVEAARRGDLELLGEMIDRGIDLTVRDPEGENAMTRAAEDGHAETLRRLIAAGVDPDLPSRSGETALMKAMASRAEGADRVIEVLLEAGADVHARDEAGRALIDHAARGASSRKLVLIRESGSSWTPSAIRAALSEATAAGLAPVVSALLPYVESAQARSVAACRATEQGNLELVGLLASNSAVLEGDCGGGRTPLALAARSGDVQLVSKLLELGARPDAGPAERDTALIAACGRGHSKIADVLLRNGADANRRGTRRMTALMAAAVNGHSDIVRRLLEAGASPRMRSDTQRTAFDLAQQAGHTEIAAVIEAYRPAWQNWFRPEAK